MSEAPGPGRLLMPGTGSLDKMLTVSCGNSYRRNTAAIQTGGEGKCHLSLADEPKIALVPDGPASRGDRPSVVLLMPL